MSDGLATEPPSTEAAGYELLRYACARYELKHSCLLELRGDDRKAWLQGQATNDLRKVQDGDSIAFCVCTPTGQMVAMCDLWALPGRYLIRAHRRSQESLLERIDKMVVMEDVQVADLTPSYKLISLQGPSATAELRKFIDLPLLDAGVANFEGDEVVCLRSNRTGLGGWDVLLPLGAKKAAKKLEGAFSEVDEAAFDVARLEAGMPRFGVDMDERTLPPEMGPAFEARTISYAKGCYTGQEVLMRIHSRGHTNKTWMALVSDRPMAVGAKVAAGKREDAGTITSAGDSPQFGFIAGAMLRNEAAFDGEIVLVGEEGFEAEVRPLPLLLLQ